MSKRKQNRFSSKPKKIGIAKDVEESAAGQSTFLISWGTRGREETTLRRMLLVQGLGSVTFDHIEATVTIKHSGNTDLTKIRKVIEDSGAQIIEQGIEAKLWILLVRLRSLLLRSRIS